VILSFSALLALIQEKSIIVSTALGVIPNLIGNPDYIDLHWIPAFAGMTPGEILI